MVRKIRLRGER
jgi:hypothetical protein